MFAANSCISSVTIHVRKVLPLFVGLGERACGSARFSAGSDQKKHERVTFCTVVILGVA